MSFGRMKNRARSDKGGNGIGHGDILDAMAVAYPLISFQWGKGKLRRVAQATAREDYE